MAAMKSGCLGTVLSTAFTSLVAPLLVGLILRGNAGKSKPAEPPPAVPVAPAGDHSLTAPPAGLPVEHRVNVQGVGRTPEEALQDALRRAVRRVAASLVDAPTWTRHGRVIHEALRGGGAPLVLRYEEVGCWQERYPEGDRYRRHLAAVVAPEALAGRLRAAGVPTGKPGLGGNSVPDGPGR